MSTRETIFALTTPLARSGVAIVRLSGPQALPALTRLTGKSDWQPNHAALCNLRNPETSETLDCGLALYFKAPASFTGEDVVELHLHGSLAVIRETLEALSHIDGLRPAEAGEFSKRAFLNGKMDLVEAEGLLDLIESESAEQKKQALRQMQGDISRYYDDLRTRTLKVLAHLEAYIDFPDEEIPESVLHGLAGEIDELASVIEAALGDNRRGERLRDGVHIVIVGAPNAGKSSLLNALAGREAAIVSHRAGTTRDVIEVHMDVGGFPVILMDTAGLRDSGDDIEEEGIRRALQRAGGADLKLVMFDATQEKMDEQSRGLIDDNSLIIINKCDIFSSRITNHEPRTTHFISAKTGQGVDALLAAIAEKITGFFNAGAAPMITRHRHRAQLERALSHLRAVNTGAPLELTCEELRLAAQAVGKITGKIAVDDVLGVIFNEFCIGK